MLVIFNLYDKYQKITNACKYAILFANDMLVACMQRRILLVALKNDNLIRMLDLFMLYNVNYTYIFGY